MAKLVDAQVLGTCGVTLGGSSPLPRTRKINNMSFQAYLDAIEDKTGKTSNDLIAMATNKGFDKNTKAGDILSWLKDEYGLGRGYGMALVSIFKNGAKISEKHVNSGTSHSDPSTTLILTGKDTKNKL